MRKILKNIIDKFQDLRLGIIIDLAMSVFFFFYMSIFGSSLFFNNLIILNIHFFLIFLLFFNFLFNIYGSYIRYFSIQDFIRIIGSISVSSLLYLLYFAPFNYNFTSILIVFISITSFFYVGIRVLINYAYNSTVIEGEKTIIFGAGKNGISLKRAFFTYRDFRIVAFLDDNVNWFNKSIDGVPVFKISKKFTDFISKNKIKNIIISTDKISKNRKIYLLNFFKNQNLRVFELQSPNKLITNKFKINDLKLLKIEDFLTRDEITLDFDLNKSYYKNKTILVSGGAGSIGSQIVKELSGFLPKKIIIVDINETAVFYLKKILLNKYKNIVFEFKLVNIIDYVFLNNIFEENDIDYVFHAAAYKHVPLMESDPKIAVINNLLGTKNIAELSVKFKIKKFLLVSSDKAVNPSNVMGATKRLCEILISLYEFTNTHFITTRFGNVLGSNGSVIPVFIKQIENGGPVTVTDKNIERFFMTIPEASKLVLEACRMGNNNKIYIFDMGSPVKIYDLAKKMINIYEHSSSDKIKIKVIGLRPGEKMYEELLKNTENLIKSDNDHIFIAKKDDFSKEIFSEIDEIIKFCHSKNYNNYDLVTAIKKIIPEFKSMNSKYQTLDK